MLTLYVTTPFGTETYESDNPRTLLHAVRGVLHLHGRRVHSVELLDSRGQQLGKVSRDCDINGFYRPLITYDDLLQSIRERRPICLEYSYYFGGCPNA